MSRKASGRPIVDADPSDLLNLVQQSEALVDLLNGFFVKLDTRRSGDFRAIAESIARAKADIRDLRPQSSLQSGFPTAGAELHAITQDTEGATETIMTAAEAILAMDATDPDTGSRITDEVMKIFEACSFQDITGQRVSKIVKVLNQIEERVAQLAEAIGGADGIYEAASQELSAAEKRARDLLLNGPAIGGPETKQAEIDALFG